MKHGSQSLPVFRAFQLTPSTASIFPSALGRNPFRFLGRFNKGLTPSPLFYPPLPSQSLPVFRAFQLKVIFVHNCVLEEYSRNPFRFLGRFNEFVNVILNKAILEVCRNPFRFLGRFNDIVARVKELVAGGLVAIPSGF